MNLYRSFGNFMEAWVTEGSQSSDLDVIGNNDEDSPVFSSDTRPNLYFDSVDSGVETAGSDTSSPATSCLVSADNAETDAFIPQREGDRLTPASTSQSPVLPSPMPSSSSSSSPLHCPSSAQEDANMLHLKVEQALKRTGSKCVKGNSGPLEDALRRQSRASLQPRRHISEIVRVQRSPSLGAHRTVKSSVPARQMSEMRRQSTSVSFDKQRSEEERKDLSPGLRYLEQVCQMLEEIARQQMDNRALQMERNGLWGHEDMQAPHTFHSDSTGSQGDRSSCQKLENAEFSITKPQCEKDNSQRNCRQRSLSDTSIATQHLRKLNVHCRGQHLITDGLLDKANENQEKQESKKEKRNRPYKYWKLRFWSLRKESAMSQQMQSSEKTSGQQRLNQLFRRRKNAVPE
ncbi:uncharacterized protein LOC113124797 [Mastacembelus armatus]|uniref:uncharacterized protein LOC113124797 n=1 Tax=Mastacembelus armatus TaxID=205130 RepID=UPI000E45546D|nr:uncharacterized protein LOC113124797 [Mastacembelus armatus]